MLVEPMIIVVLGALVGGLMIALYPPIIELGQVV
jgi:type IV pilus assembly protein PilC